MASDIPSHKIYIFKEQKDISCTENESILDATLTANINHTYACGGQGRCSTCRVSIMDGIDNVHPRNEAEQHIAAQLNFPPEIRLACQSRICGDITIRRMVSDKQDIDMISEEFSKDSGIALGSQQKVTIVFTDIVNERLGFFNKYLQANFNMTFGIRAGVHYGNVIVGPFDTGSMRKLAVIGDNVNYASRIEAANKEFGTTLLLSDAAYEKIKDVYPEHNSFETTLKGKTGQYQLLLY